MERAAFLRTRNSSDRKRSVYQHKWSSRAYKYIECMIIELLNEKESSLFNLYHKIHRHVWIITFYMICLQTRTTCVNSCPKVKISKTVRNFPSKLKIFDKNEVFPKSITFVYLRWRFVAIVLRSRRQGGSDGSRQSKSQGVFVHVGLDYSTMLAHRSGARSSYVYNTTHKYTKDV